METLNGLNKTKGIEIKERRAAWSMVEIEKRGEDVVR